MTKLLALTTLDIVCVWGGEQLFLPNSCNPSAWASPELCRTDFPVIATNHRCISVQKKKKKCVNVEYWKCLFNAFFKAFFFFFDIWHFLLLLEIQHEWMLIYAEVREQLRVSAFQKSDGETLRWTLLSGHAAGKSWLCSSGLLWKPEEPKNFFPGEMTCILMQNDVSLV